VRWLTLLLLAANLVIFAFYWQSQQRAERELARQRQLPEVATLRLLQEARPPLPRTPAAAAPAAAVSGALASPAARVPTPNQGASLGASASAPSVEAGTPSDAAAGDAAGPMPVEAAPGDILAETSRDPGSVAPVPVKAEPVCYRVAYFDTREDAETLSVEAGLTRTEVVEERQWLPSDYWVYIPDPGRSAQRRALRKELSDMGFENYWIQRGALKGQLSLGLYRSKDSAESLLHLLQDRGYMPRMYEKTRYSARYLVEIESLSSGDREPEWIARLGRPYPAIKTEKKPCRGLASTEVAE